jgi:hypothetical protein
MAKPRSICISGPQCSTLAGALRRRVWLDQAYFRWHPNFYIVLVAPPGIVSKSTTAGVGMSLAQKSARY